MNRNGCPTTVGICILARSLLVQAFGFFLCIKLVVQLQEALQDLFAGVRMNCEANPVVLGEVVNFVKTMAQVKSWTGIADLVPTVGGQHSMVQFDVQLPQLFYPGYGFIQRECARSGSQMFREPGGGLARSAANLRSAEH